MIIKGKFTNKSKIASMVVAGSLLFGGVGLLSGGCAGTNLHTVIRREFYRSAELDQRELEQIVSANGIKTVINIKDGRDALSREEYLFCLSNHINYINVPLGMKPDEYDIDKVMGAVSYADKPVLVHCKIGADRTGLISAIYLLDSGTSVQEASKQLSMKYHHFWFVYPQFDRAFYDYVKKRE